MLKLSRFICSTINITLFQFICISVSIFVKNFSQYFVCNIWNIILNGIVKVSPHQHQHRLNVKVLYVICFMRLPQMINWAELLSCAFWIFEIILTFQQTKKRKKRSGLRIHSIQKACMRLMISKIYSHTHTFLRIWHCMARFCIALDTFIGL